MSFEDKLSELEEIVRKLEDGSISIEYGIGLFENGLNITKDCLKILSEHKGKVSAIKKEADRILSEPLGEGYEI